MRPALWVSIAAGALGVLIGAMSVFQPESEDRSQIVLYGDSSRRARVGQVVTVNLGVDALGEASAGRKQPLQDVKLRLPLRVFRTLRLVSLEPAPDEMSIVGKGRYFHYQTLDHETVIRLRLRVTQSGRFRIPAAIYGDAHLPGQWRTTVLSRQSTSNPVDAGSSGHQLANEP